MKILRVPGIGGLFHEFFNPDQSLLRNEITVMNSVLEGNGTFWNALFQNARIKHLCAVLLDNLHDNRWKIPQYQAIAADPERFLKQAVSAPGEICSQDCSPKHFFSCLETITILCKLYSDFEFAPFQITVQDGFVLRNDSSEDLLRQSLHPNENPYLTFVDEQVIPVIEAYAPDLLFLEGRLDHYLAAVAMRVKRSRPSTHICLSRHASEYYSLNKICSLLHMNHPLFQIVDSVILDYFDDVEEKLSDVLRQHGQLHQVPNLMFRSGNSIQESPFSVPPDLTGAKMILKSASPAVDIHLEPFAKCHWNRCTFCGINKKYRHQDHISCGHAFEDKIQRIKTLPEQYRYYWFIDEALQPQQLRSLAESMQKNQTTGFWQARCRASRALLEDGLPELLYQSGLRELRIGLESASYAVLKLMNKFDDDFRLEWMEQIIQTYTETGISIHCPIILGFPQEEAEDRRKTYEFLMQMREKYPLFTFNLNILNLDVSSLLYQHWADYQIPQIEFPCPPQHFLGNWIAWMPKSLAQEIDIERQTFMREQLYPWMPVNALTTPTIFYRLSETARRTLMWKTDGIQGRDALFVFDMTLQISPSLAIMSVGDWQYLIYCWDSHHYMQGNQYLLELLQAFREPRDATAVIKDLVESNPAVFEYQELAGLVFKLFNHGYLSGEYVPRRGTKQERIKAAYNHIYETGTVLYPPAPEKLLLEFQELLTPGEALELGIGLGRNIPFLIEKGFHVTGVDLSDSAIRMLQERYGAAGVFITQDIRSFPISPSRYSLIICSMVLSYLDDAELSALAEEIVQGLTDGGILFLKDLSAEDSLASVGDDSLVEHRNCFTREKAIHFFRTLEPIEVSTVLRKEPQRIGCNGYFDLINYLGRKP